MITLIYMCIIKEEMIQWQVVEVGKIDLARPSLNKMVEIELNNWRNTIGEVAEEMEISDGSSEKILTVINTAAKFASAYPNFPQK